MEDCTVLVSIARKPDWAVHFLVHTTHMIIILGTRLDDLECLSLLYGYDREIERSEMLCILVSIVAKERCRDVKKRIRTGIERKLLANLFEDIATAVDCICHASSMRHSWLNRSSDDCIEL